MAFRLSRLVLPSRAPGRWVMPGWALLWWSLMNWPALASASGLGVLDDPTRPAVGEGVDTAGSVSTVPRLSLIRIGSGRPMAIVDNQTVTVGSRVGDRRVIAIRESEVVLAGAEGTETLRLFTDVEKRPARPAPKKHDAATSRKVGR